MNEIIREEYERFLKDGGVLYDNTPPFIIFGENKDLKGERYKVYILWDNKIITPHFGPIHSFFRLDIRDFAALFQAYAHGAKDAFRDFILEFFESKIQKRVNVKKHAFVIEARGTKRFNKSSVYFLREVRIEGVKKWKKGLYLNSDPIYFFNWAIQEEERLRLFYFGARNKGIGRLSFRKLGDLSLASLGLFGKKAEVFDLLPGVPIFET